LVKELTAYQQLTQIKAWLDGCSQFWHQVSLESKIILRFLMIGGIKNTGLALTQFFVV
jgi:hypothetical protein